MACFSPLSAWQLDSGEIVFAERGKVRRELTLPCGQCIGCRLERSRQWAVRCMHESQMHAHNSFITLTYDDEHLPRHGSLEYRHFQLFMKRLRKLYSGVRFYMCGEYGEQYGRPHYHACLFGVDFTDRDFYRRLPSGSDLYTSKILESLWPSGFSSVADVTFESAAYVARYCTKKVTGARAEEHYSRVVAETGEIVSITPEFNRMSNGGRNRTGPIGKSWFDKYKTDVYPQDYVIVRGMKCKPPRAYDKLLESIDPWTFESIEFGREMKRLASLDDNTYDRLRVRENVTRARLSFKKRILEK